MDKRRREIRTYSDAELAQPIGRERKIEAGRAVRAFESGDGWFRLQQLLEKSRAAQEAIMYGQDLNLVGLPQVHYAMGVVQTIDAFYHMMDKIIMEGREARETDE